MDRKKLKVTKQKSDSSIALQKGPKSGNQFLQLDVTTLNSKSLSSLIKESKPESKNVETQTEFEDIVALHLEALKDEFERERAELEAELTKEKRNLEGKLRDYYAKILESKDILINDLTNEKDFLWEEMRDLRESCQVVNGNVEPAESSTDDLEWDHGSDSEISRRLEKKRGSERSKITNLSLSTQVKETLLWSVMKLHKQNLIEKYQKEKQALLDKIEIEKDLIREEISSELESNYQEEIKNLRETVTGLQEVLSDMKSQKSELAKIFEGEKNALKLEISRKEEELKQKMAKNMQRKVIQAHQDWSVTKL
ncbi:ERC protein 2-like [Actinia tenebrosa]|uniref:ERC protein 2-like n=1 Tax=Actinia tenebrosa TaxID=6105 RepID=A0A6P8HQ98_ACTTE|nr:ERC protein 2-like [Actinia tenebrosa]